MRKKEEGGVAYIQLLFRGKIRLLAELEEGNAGWKNAIAFGSTGTADTPIQGHRGSRPAARRGGLASHYLVLVSREDQFTLRNFEENNGGVGE